MIKIIVLAKNIDGGTGTFIRDLFNLDKKNSVQIKILVLDQPKYRKNVKKMSPILFKGNNIQEYFFSISNLKEFYNQLVWLKKQINELKPDIVLTIDFHCLIIAQICKKLFFPQLKIIATIHNNIKEVIKHKVASLFQPILYFITRICLNNSNEVISVSKNLSKNIKTLFELKKSPRTIYYGLNHPFNKKSGNKIKKIISMGRFFPQKDFNSIIDAFAIVNKKLKSCQLQLVGDGPDKNKLKNYVKKHGIKNIEFTGWIDKSVNVLSKSDLFVFSSNWEGFGYVIIEAMSQGLPVIATDTPFGPREILDNGKYGILVPMKDPQAMADAMYELLNDKKKYNYYSKKSLQRAKYFSLDKMLNAYKKIFMQLNKIT